MKLKSILNVLITGAGNGIGKAVCEYYYNQGVNVIGVDIIFNEEAPYTTFVADITDKTSLQTISDYLEKNNIILDAIVNIAGVFTIGSFIEHDFDKIKKVMDVNILGTMLVNQVMYNHLSKKGRIIITSSEVAPLDPMPFNGIYNVSKTAVDSYSQSLRQELNLLGQKVITIRPGAVKTNLSDGSLTKTLELTKNTVLYKEQSSKFYKLVKNFMGTPIAPSKMAKTYYKALIAKKPRYIYSKHHNLGLVLLNILPKRWQCAIVKALVK
ncbi:MAG: SDR family NAD(P)-dependent oxidoreductase [Bacilli bacterium]